MIARGWLACVLCMSACAPGPTFELGRLADAGDRDDDSDEDASADEMCARNDDCPSERRYCDPERHRCVQCLGERHCRDDEWCSQRGRCIDR